MNCVSEAKSDRRHLAALDDKVNENDMQVQHR